MITVTDLLAELSALVGHDVELLEPSAGRWVVAPVDRARLRVPFWLAVRASSGAGVWRSPEAAIVGFAARAEGLSRPRRARPPEGLYALLIGLFAAGPVPVTDLTVAARAAGFSAPQINRAARWIGVARRKAGMTGGLGWTLPEGGAFPSQEAAT